MPADIQLMIDNREVGAALLRVIEVIGSERIEVGIPCPDPSNNKPPS